MLKVKIEKKTTEAPFGRCSTNRRSYKFLETHRKTPVLESPFNKVACPQLATLLKKRLQHRYFPVVTLHAYKFSRSVDARKFL